MSFGGNESRQTGSVVTKSYTDTDTTSAGRRFSLVRSTEVGLEANTDGDSSVHSENTVVTNADGPVEGEKFLFNTEFCKYTNIRNQCNTQISRFEFAQHCVIKRLERIYNFNYTLIALFLPIFRCAIYK
jgi:hypothetical protein